MSANRKIKIRAAVLVTVMLVITAASTRLQAQIGCLSNPTPFTDLGSMPSVFCQAVAGAYFSGLTGGTTATTFSPSMNVTREQMAAFITRTLDQSLKRGSQRAALGQFWTTKDADNLALTTVGVGPSHLKSDGADLWVANTSSATVSRVRASDGKLLETWTGATNAASVLVAMGKVFVTGSTNPGGSLYQIDPTQPAGPVTTLSASLGAEPQGIAYDGLRIWTANVGGSVSIITLNPITVTTVATGFSQPRGILYDGSNIWVTDTGDYSLKRLDSSGAVAQAINLGTHPLFAAFDGTNIWLPLFYSDMVAVVRASTGEVIATLTGNGLRAPYTAAFDGERILVTNLYGHSVSLWKASDLTPIGRYGTGADTYPYGACSDGLNFWITLPFTGKLARF